AVEARVDAIGDAALAGEEGVADAGEGAEGGGLEHVPHCVTPGLRVARICCRHRRVCAHVSKPGGISGLGLAKAMALNRGAMPVRSSLVRRTAATSTVGA